MDKSNIIVFRKGGYLASHERWFYDDLKVEVFNVKNWYAEGGKLLST